MSDPIYDLFLLPTSSERRRILRTIKYIARQTGLHKRNVDISPLETRINSFAERMKQRPDLHPRLQGKKATVDRLADIYYQSISDGGPVLVGKRGAETTRGKRDEVARKFRKNRRQEHRDKIESFQVSDIEINADKREGFSFKTTGLLPIQPKKLIRDLTIADFRRLLDYKGSDGFTALDVLIISVFAKHSHRLAKKLSPRPRTNMNGQVMIQMKLGLDKLDC